MQLDYQRILVPVAIVAAALLVGFVVDRVVVSRIRAAAGTRGWRGGEAAARSLSGMTSVLAALIGVWGALEWLDLPARSSRIAHMWLLVAVVTAVTVVGAKLAANLTRAYTSREGSQLPASTIFVNIVRAAVVVVGALVALNVLGVSIAPLLTALGVGGLAVALALQDTLSNLFSGLQLIGSKQISPGEYITLGSGEEGYIEDVTWRFTTIRQVSNSLVVIPNAKLAESLIVNYHAPEKEMSVSLEASVAYDSDLDLVERATVETAREVSARVEGAVEEFTPLVRFHTFGPNSIGFTVILRVREYTDQYLLKHEFIKALRKRYAAEGIDIPLPGRVVAPAVPAPSESGSSQSL